MTEIPPSFRATIIVCVNALADALKNINTAEKRGKCQELIRPCSKATDRLLTVIMKDGQLANSTSPMVAELGKLCELHRQAE